MDHFAKMSPAFQLRRIVVAAGALDPDAHNPFDGDIGRSINASAFGAYRAEQRGFVVFGNK
jgi:hypothetical protein